MLPRPIRLMLVDDHPLMRDGLRSRLEDVPGFEVVAEAGTAEEALGGLAARRPHLALVDVGLKGTSGIDLVPLLLEHDASLRILMFTMHDNPDYVHRAMQAGAHGYVLKDVEATEIFMAIETLAAGGTFLSPSISRRLFRNQSSRPILSARESQILSALARGMSSKDIAFEMAVSVRTVETHRQSIKRKLCLEGPAQLMQYAVRHAAAFD